MKKILFIALLMLITFFFISCTAFQKDLKYTELTPEQKAKIEANEKNLKKGTITKDQFEKNKIKIIVEEGRPYSIEELQNLTAGTAGAKVRAFDHYEGNDANALDSIDTAYLTDGDFSFTTTSTGAFTVHWYDSDNSEPESVPYIVYPNDRSGSGAWKLASSFVTYPTAQPAIVGRDSDQNYDEAWKLYGDSDGMDAYFYMQIQVSDSLETYITIDGVTEKLIIHKPTTFGAGVADIDYVITIDGETNDFVGTWMEDEDYFDFGDDTRWGDGTNYINISDTGQITFGGTGDINLPADSVDSADVNFNYAGSSSEAGNATAALALVNNGANCSAGEYPLGVDANAAVEDCTDATTEINSVVNAHANADGTSHTYIDQDLTVTGTPTHDSLTVTTETYDASGWDADNTVPTKDAVRDKMESLPGGHAAVTVSGSYTYFTLSGQELIRGQVNLTTDITGTLPMGNGGLGVTSFTDGGVILGDGSNSPVAMSVLTPGQILVGDGATDPSAKIPVISEFVPIGWMDDTASPPAAIATESTTTSARGYKCRKFDGATDESVTINWSISSNLITATGLKFRWIALITEGAITTDSIEFELSGYSLGDNDPADVATFGTVQTSEWNQQSANDEDLIVSPWSSALISTHITNLTAGDIVLFLLNRDADDAVNDDNTDDICVIGIELKWTENLNLMSF
jgi:hypothetical protein